MVNAAAAIDTGSTSLSLSSRAAMANAVLSSGAAVSAPEQAGGHVTNLGQTLRYNSFEFSYRQDFGKIVLLRQEPETGEVVQQFPTEYYLAKYAESERASRQPQQPAHTSGTVAKGETAPADVAPPAVASGGVGGTVEAAPVVASAPAITSAPALPGGGVDITV